MPEQQKAAKVLPPSDAKIIEVDMTKVHMTVVTLSVTTVALTAVTVSLWRRVRRIENDAEALRVLITRLVNDTECGQVAYTNVVRDAEAEERGESIADVDDFVPYPEEEESEGIESLYTPEALKRFHNE